MSPKLLNILLISSSIVLYFYVIDPLYTGADSGLWSPEQNVKSLLISRNQYDNTIKGVDAIMRQANNLNKDYEIFDEKSRNQMMIMVPNSIEEVKLLSELTVIANKAEFAIEDLNTKDKGGEFSITFVVKTTYPKFKKFIEYYDNSMRLLTLKSVSFNPSKNEEEIIKFNVELSTYYMK